MGDRITCWWYPAWLHEVTLHQLTTTLSSTSMLISRYIPHPDWGGCAKLIPTRANKQNTRANKQTINIWKSSNGQFKKQRKKSAIHPSHLQLASITVTEKVNNLPLALNANGRAALFSQQKGCLPSWNIRAYRLHKIHNFTFNKLFVSSSTKTTINQSVEFVSGAIGNCCLLPSCCRILICISSSLP